MTIEEYLDYDDGTDTRYELVAGVPVALGGEPPINSAIGSFLLFQFFGIGISHRRMAMGHLVGTDCLATTVRIPKLMIHSDASFQAIMADGRLLRFDMPAPRLVVEVAPGTEKLAEYEARGIPEYWIADPVGKLVTVCTLDNGSYQVKEFRGDAAISSPTFPAFTLTAAQILAAGM
jgi:Uma2 family endonuclease